jgi:hypothetical protein
MAEQSASSETTQVLEEGNIYFIYRPKVEHEEVNSLNDVQQFNIVLEPHGREWFRLIKVGKKVLPDPEEPSQPLWGFVVSVTDSSKELESGLRRDTYSTKTLGDRTQPAARPVGEGVYKIVMFDGQARLVYALELPHDLGEAQEAFNIKQTGNYAISVKNPEKGSPPGQGFQEPGRKADLPQSLQQTFSDRRFIPLESADFLDYVDTEILLISTYADSAEDIGATLNPQDEDESTAEIINNLRMKKTRHPLAPLLEGEFE